MRKIVLSVGEYYHVYNRGTDKRDVFLSKEDMERFFLCMSEFNTINPVGSIFEINHTKRVFGGLASKSRKPLVEFVAYCLNPNHYHFVVKQIAENGVSKFMQRLGTGYTMYFNEKNKRTGALFQGPYKVKHISNNEYLLHLSAYVNLNFEVHNFGGLASKMYISSWNEYLGKGKRQFCAKDIILSQFPTLESFKTHHKGTLQSIIVRKENEKGLQDILLEA